MTWGSPRMLVAFTLATLATVAVIVILATGTWWALPFAMLGHLAGLVVAMKPTFAALGQQEKPDPLDEARFEEEGRGPAGDRLEEPVQQPASAADAAAEDDEPRMAI